MTGPREPDLAGGFVFRVREEQLMGRVAGYYAIRCFTCKRNVLKNTLRQHHLGHDVHYVDKRGEIVE